MKHIHKFFGLFLIVILFSACGSADGVYFANLEDGDTVDPAVLVEMGVNGMLLEPAGPPKEGAGHHHIIIDEGFIPEGKVIPADANHIHFGKAQTEALVRLTPGEHTLTLQFADGLHRSYGEKWSKTITVKVQ